MFALLAILGVALAMRLLAWSRAEMMMNDGPHFLWQAQALFEGHWREAVGHHYAPGFAGATALMLELIDDPLQAAIAVAMISGLLIVVAAWGLARCAFPETPAVAPAAALMAAINVRCVAYTSDVQADGFFAALFLLAAWALVAAVGRASRPGDTSRQRGAAPLAVVAGLAMGLAYLVRLEALFLMVPLGLWCIGGLTRLGPGLRQRATLTLIVAASAMLTMAPYVIGLHEVTGHWGLSNKPSAQQAGLAFDTLSRPARDASPLSWPHVFRRKSPQGNNGGDRGQSNPSVNSAAHGSSGGADSSGHPTAPDPTPGEPRQGSLSPWSGALKLLSLLPLTTAKTPVTEAPVVPQGFGWAAAVQHSLRTFLHALRLEYLLLIIPGLLLLRRRQPGLCTVLLLTVAAWLAITVEQLRLSGFLSTRHMMIPIALLLPVAGAGLVSLWGKSTFWRVLVVLALLEPVEVANRNYDSNHVPRLAALAWIREHSEPDQLFATHRQRDGYYAQRTPLILELPVDTAAMAARCRSLDVPWMALDLEKLQALEPEWLEQGLIIEKKRFGEGDETVVVYAPAFDGPP